MVSTDTEKLAVLKVQEEILRDGEYLSEYINSNDRTPMWDGNIYVYNDKNKEKKNYIGKIETQVKGENVSKLKRGNSKYLLEIETLEAYQKDKKGTLLLVCKYIDIDNYQLYYANLLPVDLEEILTRAYRKNKKGKSKISIDIKPIKRNSMASLKNVCLNFLRESNKQMNIKIVDIKELKNIKNFKFQITGIRNENDMIDYVLNNGIYAYATTDSNETVAIKKFISQSIETHKEHKISINGRVYYNTESIIYTKDKEMIKLGKGIIIEKNAIKIIPNGNLYERIKDLHFFFELFNNQSFKIDDIEFSMPYNEKTVDEETIKNLKDYLIWLEKAEKMFNRFKTKFDVDFNLLEEKDFRNIDNLIELCNGNYTKVKEFNKLYYTKIYKYKIIYIIRKCEDGQVDVIDYYDDLKDIYKTVVYLGKGTSKEGIIVSPYINLLPQDYLEHLNFKCDIVKSSFSNIDIRLDGLVTEFVLNCIRAYDIDNSKIEILDLAMAVNNELLEKSKNVVNIINSFQIIRRKRKLETEEIKQLIEIRDKESSKIIKAAICILLENYTEFEFYYSEISIKEKLEFKKYPILNLKKK